MLSFICYKTKINYFFKTKIMLQVYKQTKSLFLNLWSISFIWGGEWPAWVDPQQDTMKKVPDPTVKKDLGKLQYELGLENWKNPHITLEMRKASPDWAYLLSVTWSERIREIWGKYGRKLRNNFELAVEANYLMSKQDFDFTKYGSVDTFLSQVGAVWELSYEKENTKISLAAEYVKVFRKEFAEKTRTWEDADYTYVETLFAWFSGARRWKFVAELEQALGSWTVVKWGISYSILKELQMYDFPWSKKSALGFKLAVTQALSDSVSMSAWVEKDASGTQYIGKITYNGGSYTLYIKWSYLDRSDSQISNSWGVWLGLQIPFWWKSSLNKQQKKIAEINAKFKELENQEILQYVQNNPALLEEADNKWNLILDPRRLPDYIVWGSFAEGSKKEKTEKPKEDAETIIEAPTVSNITETSAKVQNNISDADGIQEIVYYVLDASGNPIENNTTGQFTWLTPETDYKAKVSAKVKNATTGEWEDILSPETSFRTSEIPNQAPTQPTLTGNTIITIGDSMHLQFSSIDAEWNALTYRVVGDIPTGTSFDAITGKLTGVPTEVRSGSFEVVANDGKVDSESLTVNYEVKEVPFTAPTFNNMTIHDNFWFYGWEEFPLDCTNCENLTLSLVNSDGVPVSLVSWNPPKLVFENGFYDLNEDTDKNITISWDDNNGHTWTNTFVLTIINDG